MSEQDIRQAVVLQRPTTDDLDAWKMYWKAHGQSWRTEPEIDMKRQEELAQRRTLVPDIKQGIYPFKEVKLSRADVEWLLVTHDKGRGPINWNDESQRDRQGLDLRGADLSKVDLRSLPLARMRSGLTSKELLDANKGKVSRRMSLDNRPASMAVVCMQKADLSGSELQGAFLMEAQLQKADLIGTQLQGANLSRAQLQKADLTDAQLQKADLAFAQLQSASLWHAQLQGAFLRWAQLQKADLTDAQLQGANLRQAQLQEARLAGTQAHGAILMGAQLQKANISGRAQLQKADLRSAQLQDFTFRIPVARSQPKGG